MRYNKSTIKLPFNRLNPVTLTLHCIFYWNLVTGQIQQKDIPAAGGKVATLGQLPHAVVLITKQGKCTGAIIDASWILTAGHCVSDSKGYPVSSDNIQVKYITTFNRITYHNY